MPNVLITRPKYEPATHYLYYWSSIIVDEAKRRGKVYDLEKEKATREKVESYLKKMNPEIVIINGHGNEDSVTGHDNEVLIYSKNANLLKNCMVYIRACSAGKFLGPEIVRLGAKSFIGYKEPFLFYCKDEFLHKPLKDDYAKPFFETSNQVGLSLLKGKTAQEANEDSFKVYRKMISNLLTSKAENSFLIPHLLWNMRNQVCYE